MAVANAIAPEHLELMSADPEALVPLVRHAGAVFCGPWAPASVGDYLAGPSHVLPTFGSARFGQALTVDDFTKQVHVVSLDEAALAKVAPHVAALAEAEGLPAHAASGPNAHHRGGAMIRPKVRDDLGALDGYHSPQVDVDVRLNTNESPEPPPRGWRDALAAELSRVEWHRYPDRAAIELRSAIAELHHVVARAGLRRERLERSAPDPAPRLRRSRSHCTDVRADVSAAHAHRARHRDRRSRRRSAPPTSSSISSQRGTRSPWCDLRSPFSARRTTPPASSRPRRRSGRSRRGRPASSSSTRRTASSRRGRL